MLSHILLASKSPEDSGLASRFCCGVFSDKLRVLHHSAIVTFDSVPGCDPRSLSNPLGGSAAWYSRMRFESRHTQRTVNMRSQGTSVHTHIVVRSRISSRLDLEIPVTGFSNEVRVLLHEMVCDVAFQEISVE